jgi:hypothetical protein
MVKTIAVSLLLIVAGTTGCGEYGSSPAETADYSVRYSGTWQAEYEAEIKLSSGESVAGSIIQTVRVFL